MINYLKCEHIMLMILKTIINPVKSLDRTSVWAYIVDVRCETIRILKEYIETDTF